MGLFPVGDFCQDPREERREGRAEERSERQRFMGEGFLSVLAGETLFLSYCRLSHAMELRSSQRQKRPRGWRPRRLVENGRASGKTADSHSHSAAQPHSPSPGSWQKSPTGKRPIVRYRFRTCIFLFRWKPNSSLFTTRSYMCVLNTNERRTMGAAMYNRTACVQAASECWRR